MNQMEIFKNPEFGSIRTFEQNGRSCFAEKILPKHSDTDARLTLSRPIVKGSVFYRPLLTAGFNK